MSSPSPSRRSVDSFESLQSPSSQRNQYPFPQHDRPNSTGRYNPSRGRRGSTASSIHSIHSLSSVGGALDTSSQSRMGSVKEVGQNASGASGHKPPSAKDIPPVTLTNIPHIDSTAFNSYLSQVGSLYDAFQRAKAETDGGSSQIFKRDSDKKEEFDEIVEKGLQRDHAVTPPLTRPSIAALSPGASPQPRRRSSGGVSRRNLNAVTPLSTIPNVYFDDNFHLENPRTFDIVSERSEVIRQPQTRSDTDSNGANGRLESPQPPGRKALASNAILQEKLSWYMDTVEVHLISSISTASTSFFAALGSLRELQSEAAESVSKIKSLREDLSNLDRQMAVGGLKIIDMKRRRENLRKLTDATDQLQSVMQGFSHCEELIDRGELETAITRIDALEKLIAGDLNITDPSTVLWLQPHLPSRLVDLRSLKAFDGLAEGIQQLRSRIGKGFEARFLETLLVDLRQHVQSVPQKDTLQRWASASQRSRGNHNRMQSILPAYMKTNETFRSDLRANLIGLSASNYTTKAAAAFRDAIVREMKVLIRHHLPSASDDDAESVTSVSTRSSRLHSQQDKSSILSRNLRALDSADAEELFVKIYSDVGEALRRLSIQVKVLLDVTSGVGTPPPSAGGTRSPPRSPNLGSIDGYMNARGPILESSDLQEELMQALDMSSLLGQAVDAAQTQITKILRVRSEGTTHLELPRFLRYFSLNRLFADECEAVSGRSGAALKGVVNDHIGQFVSLMGETEKQRLNQVMDSDRWKAKDFGDSNNDVLLRILQGMTSDPVIWSKSSMIWEDIDLAMNGTATLDTNGNSKEKSQGPSHAIVDEERYVVSASAVAALKGVDRFENLIAAIPSMTAEVSVLICDYLKLFNSRLCQQILGAGAIHSAGLENINTRHLATASQALSFMIAILPYVREFARRHSPSSRASIAEFDNVKRLLQDQQVSIHDKLIDIMSNRAAVHVKNLKKIIWDEDTARQVSPNMETLTKDTLTLHKVISRILSDTSVRMIMLPVFVSYREQVGKAFSDAVVKTAAGKSRLLRDAQLFDSMLGQIDGAGDTGPYLIRLVNEKTTETPTPPPVPSHAGDSGGRSSPEKPAVTNGTEAAS
ncbi:Vps54-domain-containing protein [Mytilinidion resinicola]|uniref:Vacuolar protein sorting-associated protein 54 n=1 Tax=Mytilinidion resinicola TaxID=574789 RepID=A0A6A6Z4T0_9PEZI|nr:Vps54-domain-containing protein [Mytilinidion resinicola]KAF2816030.1 Vps54-domain-containing protein [Mytilinidion resinicola]